MNNRDEVKAARERQVFAEFVELAKLPLVEGSIQSRPPPEPDVLCEVVGYGPVAFELVELVDAGFRQLTEEMNRLRTALRAYPSELDSESRQRIYESLGNAYVAVRLYDPKKARQCIDAIPELFEWLKTLGSDVAGYEVEPPARLLELFGPVGIYRHKTHSGLDIDTASGGNVGDPTKEQLQRKFGRAYRSDYPVELLAYADIDLLLPLDAWYPDIAPYVDSLLASDGAPFRRVWVVSLASGKERGIKLVMPEYQP